MHPEEFKLTAYALGEIEGPELTALEEHLRGCDACRHAIDEARAFGSLVTDEWEKEPLPEPALWPRNVFYPRTNILDLLRPSRWRWVEVSLASAAALFLMIGLSSFVSFLLESGHERRAAVSSRPQVAQAQQPPAEFDHYVVSESPRVTEVSPVLPDANSFSLDEAKLTEPVPRTSKPIVQKESRGGLGGFNIPGLGNDPVVRGSGGIHRSGAGANVSNRQDFGGRGQGQRLTMTRRKSPSQNAHHNYQLPVGGAAEPISNNAEAYSQITDNPFRDVQDHPKSTFSIDVDTASYSNLRRFLTSGNWPPKDAVRIEEMLNYFTYDYAPPKDEKPFATHVEVSECPWNLEHRLARIALKGREVSNEGRPVSNLVFLLDVSGSMQPVNKLPLVKQAMRMLVEKLGENDRVAIVVYAGASGLALPSTTCDRKEAVLNAIERLQAGGSTAGGAGIELAYSIAQSNFIQGGTNRVILCTDGDFNVGITDQEALKSLVKQKAGGGVFLSVLGFGMDNLKDDRLEMLADCGNGNYGYIDREQEAKKLFVDQLSGTLVTIAKDVKIQIEFNPAQVSGYRLIGYENRVLRNKDFRDDRVDAGDIGAGHTVTALYEIVPSGQAWNGEAGERLKYRKPARPAVMVGAESQELLTVWLRYKEPDGKTSRELEYAVADPHRPLAESSKDLRFAAAVAEFGMLLRNSPYKGNASFDHVLQLAQAGLVTDESGYRAEFISLVNLAKQSRPE